MSAPSDANQILRDHTKLIERIGAFQRYWSDLLPAQALAGLDLIEEEATAARRDFIGYIDE